MFIVEIWRITFEGSWNGKMVVKKADLSRACVGHICIVYTDT